MGMSVGFLPGPLWALTEAPLKVLPAPTEAPGSTRKHSEAFREEAARVHPHVPFQQSSANRSEDIHGEGALKPPEGSILHLPAPRPSLLPPVWAPDSHCHCC